MGAPPGRGAAHRGLPHPRAARAAARAEAAALVAAAARAARATRAPSAATQPAATTALAAAALAVDRRARYHRHLWRRR